MLEWVAFFYNKCRTRYMFIHSQGKRERLCERRLSCAQIPHECDHHRVFTWYQRKRQFLSLFPEFYFGA